MADLGVKFDNEPEIVFYFYKNEGRDQYFISDPFDLVVSMETEVAHKGFSLKLMVMQNGYTFNGKKIILPTRTKQTSPYVFKDVRLFLTSDSPTPLASVSMLVDVQIKDQANGGARVGQLTQKTFKISKFNLTQKPKDAEA